MLLSFYTLSNEFAFSAIFPRLQPRGKRVQLILQINWLNSSHGLLIWVGRNKWKYIRVQKFSTGDKLVSGEFHMVRHFWLKLEFH